jgi:hypothetical protein
MIDNQLVEIGVLFAAFNEEPITKALTCDIRIGLSNVCDSFAVSNKVKCRGRQHTDVLIQSVVHLPSDCQMILTLG